MAKTIPAGFKFRPTDQQLIHDYLFNKIVGKELPFEGIILERDVYDEQVLSEIVRSWNESGDTRSYFFTRLKKKAANYCRTVGNGTWRSQYSRVINNVESNTIGIKCSFEYMNNGSVQHKKWIMMEFSLADVSLEQPRSSKDYVICMLKKSRGGKHGKEETTQSNRNGDEALMNMPSGCFNNKRIKLIATQNQKIENDTSAMLPSGNSSYAVIKSAPIVGEQVGLIHGEAGVKTLEQIMRDLLAPEPSMEDVANVVAADTLATLPPSGHYAVPDSILPFDSMPPLMQAKPAPIVDEEGGYALGQNEVRMQPSIADQSLHSSNDEFAVSNHLWSLASAPEVTAAENDVGNLVQPSIADQSLLSKQRCMPAPESLPADSPGHAVLNSIISLATPAPMVEPSIVQDTFLNKYPEITAAKIDVGILEQTAPTVEPTAKIDNRIWVESFAEDLLSVQHDLPLQENDQEQGAGHFSPIGGYHAGKGMALVLDVACFKYPPHWVPLKLLWEAMDTVDGYSGRPRGFMLMSKLHRVPALLYTLSCKHESWISTAKYLVDDVPCLLKSKDVKNIKDVLSVVLSSLPNNFSEFIKWVVEVRRQEENGGLSLTRGEWCYQEFLSSEKSCCRTIPRTAHEDNLPDIAACVCCQGAGLMSGISGLSHGFCCQETCVKCIKINGEKPVTVVSATVVSNNGEQGVDVLVSSSQSEASSCSCSTTNIGTYPGTNDVLTVLLLALPPETWSDIKEGSFWRKYIVLFQLKTFLHCYKKRHDRSCTYEVNSSFSRDAKTISSIRRVPLRATGRVGQWVAHLIPPLRIGVDCFTVIAQSRWWVQFGEGETLLALCPSSG
ncbi:phytochelatin synthase 1 [Actinidia rufa]|uniref:glutathione gamma-glutamylcysteinyltransferase n=1 Tax=Actinidia rufa TaxID=165716 RepID=A0A7J0HB20_9ERIC|nr:phytochelatin synthase 1 [Actinidia rufa]